MGINILKKHAKTKAGYTIVELLVVVAIIAIMSVIGLASLKSPRALSKVRAAQREAASVIRLAQSYALQGKTQNIPALGQSVPCGYGVRFIDNANYEIFYNYDTNTSDSISCKLLTLYGRDGVAGGFDDTEYRKYTGGAPFYRSAESFKLKDGATLKAPVPAGNATIYFTVPFAGKYDYTGGALNIPLLLTFTFSGTDKFITISPGGDITEQN